MIKLNQIIIKVVGEWDTKIFTPAFVDTVLLGSAEKDTLEIQFTKELQPIYNYKQIRIVPTSKAVEIFLINNEKETTDKAIEILVNLVTALPFTPNLFIGFNYQYSFGGLNEANKLQLAMFPGFEVNSLTLSKKEDDFILNAILNYEESETLVYNFHLLRLESINENSISNHLNYIETLWKKIL